jgi:hypothetical protein
VHENQDAEQDEEWAEICEQRMKMRNNNIHNPILNLNCGGRQGIQKLRA